MVDAFDAVDLLGLFSLSSRLHDAKNFRASGSAYHVYISTPRT